MVFGLFEGSIDVLLPKTLFSFGETIEGTLVLKLKKEKNAKQLKVTIFAVQETTRRNSNGSISTNSNTVFTADYIVDGEKTYMPPGGEFPFKAALPGASVLPQRVQQVQGGGVVGTLANVAIAMSTAGMAPVKWYLKASLNVPKEIDISKQVQISVQ